MRLYLFIHAPALTLPQDVQDRAINAALLVLTHAGVRLEDCLEALAEMEDEQDTPETFDVDGKMMAAWWDAQDAARAVCGMDQQHGFSLDVLDADIPRQ
ncbi:hypothetical protein [Acidovorax sp. Root219]|uniref:hypothetical protein n=1 Tax=Acidovorax sp. Root219 TaxID=1736493 RepID=UPI00070A5703|nr:hypothetical protein [Acidovorax sp. Root219]KRC34394.1 hypothetical protein ASE28_08565 [Acidovorax sp. Root219]